LGELIDGDLVAEGEDDVVGVQELEDVGFRVAIGSDVPANNLHAYKRNDNNDSNDNMCQSAYSLFHFVLKYRKVPKAFVLRPLRAKYISF
jgi:hypothetical protein